MRSIYAYPNLFEAARPKFDDRIQHAFQHLGTNNFEGVMRLLQDASSLVREYGQPLVSEEMQADLTTVKNALVEAVANNHLQRPSEVGDDKLTQCVTFLLPYPLHHLHAASSVLRRARCQRAACALRRSPRRFI